MVRVHMHVRAFAFAPMAAVLAAACVTPVPTGASRSTPAPPGAAWPPASPATYQLPAPRAGAPIASGAAAPLPAGWTSVGGVPLPTLGSLMAGPAVTPAPPSWPFSWLSPALPSAATPVPALAAFSGRHCGAANIDGARIPLDCMTSDYATIPWAQRPVVRHGFFDRAGYVGDTPLPALVDHRTSGSHGLMRDQGPAGTCTAVSFASAVDHAVGRALGRTVSVSARHTWSRYATPRMSATADAKRGRPIAPEAAWPYESSTVCSWMTPCEAGECGAAPCGRRPDPRRVADADLAPLADVTEITRLPDPSAFAAVLAKGQAIWFAMWVGDDFTEVRGTNAIVPDADYRNAPSGHAMVLAGYKQQANGTYFLIQNSWGRRWGDGGFAWIHEATLRRNLHSAFVVDAKPRGPQNGLPAEPPIAPQPACVAGQAPDSVTEACAPLCGDGSPRTRGTCPRTGRCPSGYVDVFGLCVMSAPLRPPQTDTASNVNVVCGAAGCT